MFDKNVVPERRQFGRRAVLKHAVLCDDAGQRLNCLVIDISASGARIKIEDNIQIPDVFFVEIPADDFVVKCRIVHRQPGSVGVHFIVSPSRLSWRKSRTTPENMLKGTRMAAGLPRIE
jgi:PilZ domain